MHVDTPAVNRPNIVIILADDLGLCDLGSSGNANARTPQLDALAQSSVRFGNFLVTPVCAPTRAALLTGRHHLRTGVSHVHGGKDFLSLDETTVAERLRAAGYVTGLWGKWHSGHSDGYLPWQRGFDEALMLRLYRHRSPQGQLNGQPVEFPGRWADEVIVDHALAFAEKQQGRPFFAFVSSMTPHEPLDAEEDDMAAFMARGASRKLATLQAQVAALDRAVGRLLAGLEALGLADNTVVLFCSDNGPAMNEGYFSDAERAARNSGPLRGWKGDVYEGGVRSPLFVRWGSRLTPRDIPAVADVTDLFPSFLAWAGATPGPRPLDGRDLTPLLFGGTRPERPVVTWVHPAIPPYEGDRAWRLAFDEYRPLSPAERANMTAEDQVVALRLGRWKLLQNADLNQRRGPRRTGTQLVDLEADPGEATNLSASDPERARELAARLAAWWSEFGAEPDAFRPPLLRVDALTPQLLPAVACAALRGGLTNGVSAVVGWSTAGDTLAWQLEVRRGGRVRARLHWELREKDRVPLPGTRFRLSGGGAYIDGAVSADGTVSWDGALDLDAGPLTLELEIVALPEGNPCLALNGFELLPEP